VATDWPERDPCSQSSRAAHRKCVVMSYLRGECHIWPTVYVRISINMAMAELCKTVVLLWAIYGRCRHLDYTATRSKIHLLYKPRYVITCVGNLMEKKSPAAVCMNKRIYFENMT
jgi:hypothetical protein